jgi:hypothetical protein
VVIVDVVQINIESLHSLRDTLVPCGVVDGTADIVHSWRVWVGLVGGTEDGCVEKNKGNVVNDMVAHSDSVKLLEDLDRHGLSTLLLDVRVVDAFSRRYDPDEIEMRKCFTHELRHDTETANLDLDVPVVNVVLDCRDEDLATRRGSHDTSHGIVIASVCWFDGVDCVFLGKLLLECDNEGHEECAQAATANTSRDELDLVEGSLEDADCDETENDGTDPEKDEERQLDPLVTDGNQLVPESAIIELDAVRKMRRRWPIRDVECVHQKTGRVEAVENAITIDVTVDERLVRLATWVHSPNVKLEVGWPLVHEMPTPRAVGVELELVLQPSVKSELVEFTVGAEMREPTLMLEVEIAVLDETAAAEKSAPVLDHDVATFPLLVFGTRPRLIGESDIDLVEILPVAPG